MAIKAKQAPVKPAVKKSDDENVQQRDVQTEGAEGSEGSEHQGGDSDQGDNANQSDDGKELVQTKDRPGDAVSKDAENVQPKAAESAGRATAVVGTDEGRYALETQKRGGPANANDEAARLATNKDAMFAASRGDMSAVGASPLADDGKPVITSPDAVNRLPNGTEFYAAFVYNPNGDDRRNAENKLNDLKTGRMMHRNIPASFWNGDISKPPVAVKTENGFTING